MADYIVKDNGVGTGDAGRYTTPQTGSFATLGTANYYASITAAFAATTPPAAGDRILVSDLHAFSQAPALAYTGVATLDIHIICVDDANMDASRTSGNMGSETSTTTNVTPTDLFLSGIELVTNNNFLIRGMVVLIDSKLSTTNPADLIAPNADNTALILRNSELALNDTGSYIVCNSGALINMMGGSVTTTSLGIVSLFSGGSNNGGMTVIFKGVDLTSVTGTLIANVGATAADDDTINIHFDMCKTASGVAFTNETFTHLAHRALFTRCSDVSTDAEYQYYLQAFGGSVEDDSTIRRADDPAFEDSGTIISYKIITDSNANVGAPLWFDLPWHAWAALSAGATDTLRFFLASTVALTNKDIWIELIYPDGTNKQTPNFISSANNTVGGVIDLMATGTTLTTDAASDWRDGASALAGHNEYQIDVTASGDVGADTVPIVRVYIGKPSTTIQFASVYEFN